MRLYVMRHGLAEDRAPSGKDFDRRLTREGRAIVERVAAELLRERGAPLPRLLASPLVRAQQTAELVRAVAGTQELEVETRDELNGETLPLALAESLAEAGTDALLVGHQPIVEVLVRRLAASPSEPASSSLLAGWSGFSTAMIVSLEHTGETRWTVHAILDPRRLRG